MLMEMTFAVDGQVVLSAVEFVKRFLLELFQGWFWFHKLYSICSELFYLINGLLIYWTHVLHATDTGLNSFYAVFIDIQWFGICWIVWCSPTNWRLHKFLKHYSIEQCSSSVYCRTIFIISVMLWNPPSACGRDPSRWFLYCCAFWNNVSHICGGNGWTKQC